MANQGSQANQEIRGTKLEPDCSTLKAFRMAFRDGLLEVVSVLYRHYNIGLKNAWKGEPDYSRYETEDQWWPIEVACKRGHFDLIRWLFREAAAAVAVHPSASGLNWRGDVIPYSVLQQSSTQLCERCASGTDLDFMDWFLDEIDSHDYMYFADGGIGRYCETGSLEFVQRLVRRFASTLQARDREEALSGAKKNTDPAVEKWLAAYLAENAFLPKRS